MAPWMRRTLLVVMVLGLLKALPCPADACPFCSSQGQTLTKEVNQASFVIMGTITAARFDATGLDGTSDVAIEEVVKSHPFLKGKKTLTLPKYIPESKVKFIILCDVFKDRVDPYRGIPVKDKEIVDYLKGAVALDEKDVTRRLEFFFPYLEHPEIEINSDAYKEFAIADAKDVLTMIGKADKPKMRTRLVQWLKDRETPTYRFGLYGYLLGLCGTTADAEVLLELLNDPQRGLVSGIDGVLAGYISLTPKDGWQYLHSVIKDPTADFTRRYAALRTIRFFWEYGSNGQPRDPQGRVAPAAGSGDVVSQQDPIASMLPMLDQADIADLAIEDLRKWKQWDHLDRILALSSRESHNVPIVQRAILKYALSSPDKKAAEFVEEQRKKNPERVRDVEELLRLDQPYKPANGTGP